LPSEARVRELFERHHEPLLRYLQRFTGDADLAADAAQEAFVRLLRHQPSPDAERTWLFRVATNAARDTLRVRNRRRLLLLAGGGRVPHGDPAEPADAQVARERRRMVVREALASLRDRERAALLMRESGFSHAEIAQAVGTTTKSVGTLLARALAHLQQRLQLDEVEP
jgi:RNA polymerase sigma factor (sigma-70 family)